MRYSSSPSSSTRIHSNPSPLPAARLSHSYSSFSQLLPNPFLCSSHLLLVQKYLSSTLSSPHLLARSSQTSPVSWQCPCAPPPSSSSPLINISFANKIGFLTLVTPMTPTPLFRYPRLTITLASSSIVPLRVKTAPRPALNRGLFSSCVTVAVAMSSAVAHGLVSS